MKALILHGPGDLRLEEVVRPASSPGSVVVRVISSPVWDYVSSVIDGSLKFPQAHPLIFGTCCVGRVDEVGPDVVSLEPGQLVFCDHIVYSRDAPHHRIVLGYHGGHSPYERKLSSGHWKDGCWAEFARFPAENVHVLNEERLTRQGVELSQLCEISSVMSAVGVANAIQVRPGETVIVMPASGFFSSGAVVAVLGLGANVIAAGRNADTLQAMISHFGKDGNRITPIIMTGDKEQDAALLRAATPRGEGADAYIDFAAPECGSTYIQAGLMALKRGGRCCLAGATPLDVALPYLTIRINELTIRGSFAQDSNDVKSTIRMIESGNIQLRKSVIGALPLADIDKALKQAAETTGWREMVVLTP